MLVKRSGKNQIAIPKTVLERAGLGPRDRYFDIGYANGKIVLTPMELEERIAPEALRRFRAKVLKGQRGDRAYSTMEGLIRDLKRRR